MTDASLNGLFRRTLQRPVPAAPRGLEGGFAVIDTARNDRIYGALKRSTARSECLYSGAVHADLLRVAPQLVHLKKGTSFRREFYAHGWDHAWGIVLRTSVDFTSLRRHLRTLAYVNEGRQRKLLFRYYDPRVLRAFLPVCDQPQLEALFGPIDAFVLDGTNGAPPRVVARLASGGLRWTDATGREVEPG